MFDARVLITGSAGMLGKDIAGAINNSKKYTTYGIVRSLRQVSHTDFKYECDLSNLDLLEKILKEIQPSVIIHCAAVVNLDECERNRNLADKIHCDVTELLSSFNRQHTRFIYISTDSVFDGKQGNYSEDDVPNPLNYYGVSKLRGEGISLRNNLNSVVLRTNMYGYHLNGGGNSLAEWIINNLKVDKAISGFTDVRFNPLYTKEIASLIVESFMNNERTGIWHFGTTEFINKYEFALRIARQFNYDNALITPALIDNMNFATTRPKDTTLNVSKLFKSINKEISINSGIYSFHNDFVNSERIKL